MWEAFKEGYKSRGLGPAILLGRLLGLWFKWFSLTVIAVATARAMGVAI